MKSGSASYRNNKRTTRSKKKLSNFIRSGPYTESLGTTKTEMKLVVRVGGMSLNIDIPYMDESYKFIRWIDDDYRTVM